MCQGSYEIGKTWNRCTILLESAPNFAGTGYGDGYGRSNELARMFQPAGFFAGTDGVFCYMGTDTRGARAMRPSSRRGGPAGCAAVQWLRADERRHRARGERPRGNHELVGNVCGWRFSREERAGVSREKRGTCARQSCGPGRVHRAAARRLVLPISKRIPARRRPRRMGESSR